MLLCFRSDRLHSSPSKWIRYREQLERKVKHCWNPRPRKPISVAYRSVCLDRSIHSTQKQLVWQLGPTKTDGLWSEIEILGGSHVARYVVVAESHLTILTELHLRWELHSVLCGLLRTQMVSVVTLFLVAGSWKCSRCGYRLTTLHIYNPLSGKRKVNKSRYRHEVPRGFQEVNVPRLRDNGSEWW